MNFARPNRLSTSAALSAAALLCIPVPAFSGEPAKPGHTEAVDGSAATYAVKAVDVKMTNSTVAGRLITDSGEPITGTVVSAHKAGSEDAISKAVTGTDGTFKLTGMPVGEAIISTPQGSQKVRTWAATAAPPKALPEIALVSVDPAVRGQYGLFCDPALNLSMGIATAGVVLSAITLAQINDLEDDNAAIRRAIDDLNDELTSP